MGGIAAPFLAAYLLGSVSFAYLAGRMKGLDLREAGSGTLGARNVKRMVGKGMAIIVLLLDLMKGAGAVWLAMQISDSPLAGMTGWMGVVCGHGWPIFLKFKGGKGLAASAGALLVISPLLLAAELTAGALLYAATRQIYLAAMAMAALLPFLTWLITSDRTLTAATLPVSAVILLLHRKNIKEILRRERD